MRHTKIIATLGPASSAPAAIRALVDAGVDVFRLNFSHGTHAAHAEACRGVRESARGAGRPVALLADLSGPKIRTGPLAGDAPLRLERGQTLRIAPGDAPSEPGRVFTPYAALVHSARPGDRLLLDDGRIELRVTETSGAELITEVVAGGLLWGKKGINAPGVQLPASAITEKDEDDLRFALAMGVDLVALSFVQTAGDVRRAREIATAAGTDVPLIAKIERPAAVHNLPAILEVAQGVMVARGDLGLEMPLEQVPRAQKEIISRARTAGRPVIVATQVLESMRVDPRPTRAEVSDAATAVDQGADAIMLAGETAVGAYPARSVETLDAVIRDAESAPAGHLVMPAAQPPGQRHGQALCEAAVTLATSGEADAIVAVTQEGRTARLLSSFRPAAPVYAMTPDERVAGALALCWGIVPVVSEECDIEAVERVLIDRGILPAGAVVVFVNVSSELDRVDANFLNVQRIG